MFENVMNQATTGSKKSVKTSVKERLPRTEAFVGALDKAGLRISYASLALASEALGERTPSGLSAGQRGSQVVAHLPLNLQPNVCRANGRYKKGTTWGEGEAVKEPTAELIAKGYVKPDAVHSFLTAFIEAESRQGGTAVAEPETEVVEEPVVADIDGEIPEDVAAEIEADFDEESDD